MRVTDNRTDDDKGTMRIWTVTQLYLPYVRTQYHHGPFFISTISMTPGNQTPSNKKKKKKKKDWQLMNWMAGGGSVAEWLRLHLGWLAVLTQVDYIPGRLHTRSSRAPIEIVTTVLFHHAGMLGVNWAVTKFQLYVSCSLLLRVCLHLGMAAQLHGIFGFVIRI